LQFSLNELRFNFQTFVIARIRQLAETKQSGLLPATHSLAAKGLLARNDIISAIENSLKIENYKLKI